MNLQYLTLPILLILSAVWRAESLECLSCSGALDAKECNQMVTCSNDQVCYKKREFTDQLRFELGCVNKQSCGRYATLPNTTAGIKMNGGQTQYCYECCSTPNCNKDLCEQPHQSKCDDSESVDCALLNSMFSICEIIDQAKKICPNYCGLCLVVDGNWSPWSLWSTCDVTCENGIQTRTRSCTDPAPQYGGLNCSGEGIELKPCTRQLCPVHGGWSDWGNWGECSVTCGIGMQSRLRSCTNPAPDRYGDHCFGHSIEDKLCNQSDCEIQGNWADWSQWGTCSATCGVGMQSRNRTCTSNGQDDFGSLCDGKGFEDRLCYPGGCSIKGNWANWSQWGTCSATCGVGMQSRNRTCTNNGNDNADSNCDGKGFEDRLCYPGICSKVWSEWQPWGDCSKTCRTGLKTRSRQCLNPSTFVAERECPGASNETESCIYCNLTDCYEILKNAEASNSGVYIVTLWKSNRTVRVYCDMATTNGGWTVFQYRFNGTVDFYRNFSEYEMGFGNLKSEFWLGLQIVQEMASQYKTELRIDLTAADGTAVYETFQNFYLDSKPNYKLHIDPGQGTAGDLHGLSYHNGAPFSTFDADRDTTGSNCAVKDHGGWWYKDCAHANLNGEYVTPGTKRAINTEGGVIYSSFRARDSLKITKMMFRRVE